MKKILVWLAIAPVVLALGIALFSPKAAPVEGAQAQAVGQPAASKPTALPVVYEFFAGW